ncbi:hypothetical protein D6D27_06199 [Aureobasidium pullulans]|nr:hypothetical protein D6D27_06199 [Aureobasidium pullulans]
MTECCSTQRTVSQVFDRVCQVDFRAAQSTPQCGAAASLGEIRDDTSSTDSRRQVRHVLQGHIFTSLQTLFHVSFPPSTHLLLLTTPPIHLQTNPHNPPTTIKMSGTSNVGNSSVYEAADQRTYKDSEIAEAKQEARFHEGKEHSHKANDSKDERTIANKLAREEKRENEDEKESLQTQQIKKDATLPAQSHGNEPSKGAKIDQELKEEDEAALKGKGSFGPQ